MNNGAMDVKSGQDVDHKRSSYKSITKKLFVC
jgi:hypothetical protein